MKRKFYSELLHWKETSGGKTAALIDGARRVGKSYIAREFAEKEYRSYIIIDFARLPLPVKEIFENDKDSFDLFFAKLSAYYRVVLYQRQSLFIFDEVQRFPPARELIKYLVADGRYDFIETGSLISLRKNVENIVIPSEEEHFEMFPMDFEEFLWAKGDEATFLFLRESFSVLRPLGQAMHKRIMNDFREYILTGGMPQAVAEYIKTKDFEKTDRTKRMILSLYREDVTKFAAGYESKVLSIFDEIPGQLSKKEKKYKLSSINKDARFRDYENAFLWLSESMIVNNCFNATDPTVGLSLSSEYTTRKCYMADTGLLVSHTFRDDKFTDNELYRDILLDKLHVNEGMLIENVVAQELRSSGHRLFFYSRSDSNHRENDIEIDFLVRQKRKICPIEVKSGAYQRHVSIDKYLNKFKETAGQPYILYTKDIMEKDGIIHLPIYMASLI